MEVGGLSVGTEYFQVLIVFDWFGAGRKLMQEYLGKM